MTKPIYNALLAAGYIAILVLSLSQLEHIAPKEDNILMPMGAISILVLSAAIMGFLFFYQPVILLIENKKAEALSLFLRTVGIFAIIAVLIGIASLLV